MSRRDPGSGGKSGAKNSAAKPAGERGSVPRDSVKRLPVVETALDPSCVSPNPVAPDSVHVWRGFRSPEKDPKGFAEFLGSVFVPACALLQPNAGLRAYLPSMPPHTDKPAQVPDQTALMFWETPETYHDAFRTVAVRAYTNLHGDVYGPGSSAAFPKALGKAIEAEQPYYLVERPADWMLGAVRHLIGARPEASSVAEFFAAIYAWADDLRSNLPAGIDGGLLCAGENYVVAWLLGCDADALREPMGALAKSCHVWLDSELERYVPPADLWDAWPGIELGYPSALNIQLVRPEEAGAE